MEVRRFLEGDHNTISNFYGEDLHVNQTKEQAETLHLQRELEATAQREAEDKKKADAKKHHPVRPRPASSP
jgi:hypothetical protein